MSQCSRLRVQLIIFACSLYILTIVVEYFIYYIFFTCKLNFRLLFGRELNSEGFAHIYYASLNFRDAVIATGRVSSAAFTFSDPTKVCSYDYWFIKHKWNNIYSCVEKVYCASACRSICTAMMEQIIWNQWNFLKSYQSQNINFKSIGCILHYKNAKILTILLLDVSQHTLFYKHVGYEGWCMELFG